MRPLVWFRSDLRVADNPALSHAVNIATRGVVAVFTICPKQWAEHDWGANRVAFVLASVEALSGSLRSRRIPLLIDRGEAFDDVPERLLDLAQRHACDVLLFNREYEVNERTRDAAVTDAFTDAGLDVRAFTDQVVVPPGSIRTGKGDFYTVFTPFKKKWIERINESEDVTPLRRPSALDRAVTTPDDVPDRVEGFAAAEDIIERWPAGEDEAAKRLRRFVRSAIEDYESQRDHPAVDGTSQLSPYLATGAISVRQCLEAARAANDGSLDGKNTNVATWISELVWREFYRHILVGYPRVSRHRAFKPETESLKWRNAKKDFAAWQEGRTGYPIVDAAMRQLAATGWMHNRLRMITAMFLTKDLLIDWRWGERHFMLNLVDGDLASNNGGWQWAASTGTDAAPYFRIFNPFSQSKKFDEDGRFIREWVPELAEVDTAALHDPKRLASERAEGLSYPAPIVDHAEGRDRAIAAFKRL
ncbi:MAG: deoxyribodipyrimidine photo-lyase [Phycisphaerales bacterium]|nr:deoxyribodipyrimidine photo-lyase [Phycisphaerae bacterium]NNF44109.1 deoxyribodipyrimidine photo-lyase [Phycisphaerales bacterium]NNM24767.1 deoxyribodipyrimidine photo-lyase [Phycisphaerales bacterium]